MQTIEDAANRIRPYIAKTPILHSGEIDRMYGSGHCIYFKAENFQVCGSFKFRGAVNWTLQTEAKSIVTRSSGNFAQAIAKCGQLFDKDVTVVVPIHAPQTKVRESKRLGATVILFGTTHLEGNQKVEELLNDLPESEKTHSYDNLQVMQGQGTVALEVMQELQTFQHFLCPIGGGGLMGGCSSFIKHKRPSIETVGVEPEGAADYYASKIKNQLCEMDGRQETIADGLRANMVGVNIFPVLQQYVDRVELVSDTKIRKAMRILFEKFGLVVEPSGAAAFAGLLTEKWKPSGDVVCVISGRNVDMPKFFEYITE